MLPLVSRGGSKDELLYDATPLGIRDLLFYQPRYEQYA